VAQIVADALQFPARLAVVTGGEPLMYDLTELTEALQAAGFRTHLETSGAYPLTGQWDWVCFSPKKFKAAVENFGAAAHELKVVIYHKSDFAWAETYTEQLPPNCQLLLQPEWGRTDQMMPLIVEYVKAHPRWQVSLQTHKFMQIP
jgi:organic radical activating enzyme